MLKPARGPGREGAGFQAGFHAATLEAIAALEGICPAVAFHRRFPS